MEWLIDIIKEWLQLYLKGMIVMWTGTFAEIPDGWAICDGNNGTPDLRLVFVRGVALEEQIGDLGGAVAHTHPFTSNTHKHNIPVDIAVDEGEEHYVVTTEGEDIETSSEADTGTTDATVHYPPYYRLAYIMKL